MHHEALGSARTRRDLTALPHLPQSWIWGWGPGMGEGKVKKGRGSKEGEEKQGRVRERHPFFQTDRSHWSRIQTSVHRVYIGWREGEMQLSTDGRVTNLRRGCPSQSVVIVDVITSPSRPWIAMRPVVRPFHVSCKMLGDSSSAFLTSRRRHAVASFKLGQRTKDLAWPRFETFL